MNEMSKDNNQITTVTAPEIVCDGCATAIVKALGNVAGVAAVDVDVAAKRVTVSHDRSLPPEQIANALDRAGFSAE